MPVHEHSLESHHEILFKEYKCVTLFEHEFLLVHLVKYHETEMDYLLAQLENQV